jgi:hypothetical protein
MKAEGDCQRQQMRHFWPEIQTVTVVAFEKHCLMDLTREWRRKPPKPMQVEGWWVV